MAMETGFLQYMVELLKEDYAKELEILKVTLPKTDRNPSCTVRRKRKSW